MCGDGCGAGYLFFNRGILVLVEIEIIEAVYQCVCVFFIVVVINVFWDFEGVTAVAAFVV